VKLAALSVPACAVFALSPPKIVSITTAYLHCTRQLTFPPAFSAPHLPNFIAALAIDHFLAAILEHGALHERLRTHARVHARRLLVVVVVEDVCGAEAQKRAAAGDFVEVVVGVGDAEVAGVFGGVTVRVADEGAFGLGRGS
tara:strand:+ start:3649 stop:4074 length:426 start_codon:yes stop_codon:yes gene_type:complete